jgi:serine/threonine protein kinase
VISEDDKQANMSSLIGPKTRNDESFENRILSCLVISPPGRAIETFESINEFLEACRDFIRAHRSLYFDGNILHRDISKNNIIITDAENDQDPKGMLIDLDLAKELESGPSGARHRTGTMEFMAIEVLEGKPHTYRHDLESFFYVFLWEIICHHQEACHDSQLRAWYTGSYQTIATTKLGQMDQQKFTCILAEFPLEFESLKGLAKELRDILFPFKDGIFTRTYNDPDQLYQPMIKAFERAIARHKVDSGKTKPQSPRRKRKPPTCSTCKEVGHTKAQCQKRSMQPPH